MKRLLLLIWSVFLLYGNLCAQNKEAHYEQVAQKAYQEKAYKKAIRYYTKAAEVARFNTTKYNHYYNLACCYGLMRQADSALKYLHISINTGWTDAKHLAQDSDLDILHDRADWQSILKIVENKAIAEQANYQDISNVQLITSDIDLFWKAFDKANKNPLFAKKIYEKEYFNKGTEGLIQFLNSKIRSSKRFALAIQKRKKFYTAIRANTLKVSGQKAQIMACFQKWKELYDDATFCNVYFLIGRWSAGGTTSDHAMLIGTEMQTKDATIPQEELSFWEKSNYSPIENLPYLVAHEFIHTQQSHIRQDSTLLSSAVFEGMADFLGEMISGKIINQRVHDWVKAKEGREQEVWQRFVKDMNYNRYGLWIGNSGMAKPDFPSDQGYYVGYKICEAYYQRQTDKKQAIWDMLHIKDYRDFLAKSGYGKF